MSLWTIFLPFYAHSSWPNENLLKLYRQLETTSLHQISIIVCFVGYISMVTCNMKFWAIFNSFMPVVENRKLSKISKSMLGKNEFTPSCQMS